MLLCGLLEHLRAVNLQPRNVMFGLYRPHGPSGASRFGPSGWVTCDVLMRKQLQRRFLNLLQPGQKKLFDRIPEWQRTRRAFLARRATTARLVSLGREARRAQRVRRGAFIPIVD